MLAQGWWGSLVARGRRRFGLDVPIERFVGPVDVYHAPNYVFTQRAERARRVVTVHDMTVMLFPEWHPRERLREMLAALRSLSAPKVAGR